MEKNYTLLDVAVLELKYKAKDASKKSFDINTIFLALIVLTLIVLSALLYILIRKKMQELAFVGFIA
jgi:hypothetical protein